MYISKNIKMKKITAFLTWFSTKTMENLWKTMRCLMEKRSNPLFNMVFHKICGKNKDFILLFSHVFPQFVDSHRKGGRGKAFPQIYASSSIAAVCFMTSAS